MAYKQIVYITNKLLVMAWGNRERNHINRYSRLDVNRAPETYCEIAHLVTLNCNCIGADWLYELTSQEIDIVSFN